MKQAIFRDIREACRWTEGFFVMFEMQVGVELVPNTSEINITFEIKTMIGPNMFFINMVKMVPEEGAVGVEHDIVQGLIV